MKPLILTDLDDTLFSSMRKQSPGSALLPVTKLRNGKQSFMNERQRKTFEWLKSSGRIVPVTARSSSAFGRVDVDFGSKVAVLSNGGVILGKNGLPDQEWALKVEEISSRLAPGLREMLSFLQDSFGDEIRSWIVSEGGVEIYLCAKVNSTDDGCIARTIQEVSSRATARFDMQPYHLHVNGNNFSCTPVGISKFAAVKYLLSTCFAQWNGPTIGFGDSLTDFPFMELCDVAMTPTASQAFAAIPFTSETYHD